ncbi:hypothetical protein LCGC14_3067110 [marine sediment metagenome]|uniref:DUF2283 domain-containing protein n=1 Tax=marine sediment metagenome TaxID=412755 RepID=A0A0F8WH33_9ZZZZ
MFEIEVDHDARAIYVRLLPQTETIAHTNELQPDGNILADVTEDGRVYGLSIRTPVDEMKSYESWALELIALIADDKRLDPAVRLEEIKVATRPNDSFRDPFNDGDSPEDAWEGEIEAIAASL